MCRITGQPLVNSSPAGAAGGSLARAAVWPRSPRSPCSLAARPNVEDTWPDCDPPTKMSCSLPEELHIHEKPSLGAGSGGRRGRDPRVARLARLRPAARAASRRAAQLLRQLDSHARQTGARLPFTANTPYVNTIPAAPAAAVSRQPGDRAAHQEPRSLERAVDGRARQQAERRHRRPHLDVRLGGDAVRGRLQPLLPRPHRQRRTATSSSSRATPRRASTRARSSKAASAGSSSRTSAASWRRAAASRRTRIRG